MVLFFDYSLFSAKTKENNFLNLTNIQKKINV